jgi:phosphoglycolate phosphatase-like HAD superfamily hydrolase
MPSASVLITDIDNTIFDWVAIWAGAFKAMSRVLAEATARPIEYWFEAAHRVHVRRGATECPSLLCDLAAAERWAPQVTPARVLARAAGAYRRHWDLHLAPYPAVRQTLTTIAAQGVQIVAYTEADAALAASRLARLGLAKVIRRVFGRAPSTAGRQREWWLVDVMSQSRIPFDVIAQDDSKPNPSGLRHVLARCGVEAREAVYLGDNLWKDVAMARRVGVRAVWARYGTVRAPADADLLQRVAHWASVDAHDESRASPESVGPDWILNNDICALLSLNVLEASPS